MNEQSNNRIIDETAKQLIASAKVLVVGAGSLGCPALQYLVAMGVGTIGVVDFGFVVNEGLSAKVLFSPADKDFKKTMIVTKRLQRQNLDIKIVPHDLQVTAANVSELISDYDIIIDCTNDINTSNVLNDAAVFAGKPVIYAFTNGVEGIIAIWNIKNEDGTFSPNYRDLFAKDSEFTNEQDHSAGGMHTLAGIIGCIQANEVIKLITNTGHLLKGKAMIFNALSLQSRVIDLGHSTTFINSFLR